MAFQPLLADGKERTEKPNAFMPDYTQLQFAGGKGLLSAWAGYHFGKNNKLDLAIGYGYAPAALTRRDVHKLLMQLNHVLYTWSSGYGYFQAFAGLGGSLKLNRNEMMFVRLPEQFPPGYYAPNAIRAHIDLGLLHKTRIKSPFIQTFDFYFTLTTNDVYLVDYFTSRAFGLAEGVSLGIGIRLYLY